MWQLAAAKIGASDGGRLALWRALHEKHRSRLGSEGARWVREAAKEAEDVCSVLFDALSAAFEERPPLGIGAPLVERLFEACSSTMINREGGRELLLPLLHVAAAQAHVSREEERGLVNAHAFPDGNAARQRWSSLSLATRLAARPSATGTLADGGSGAVSLAAIARAASQKQVLPNAEPLAPAAAIDDMDSAFASDPPSAGSATARSRWSSVQAAIIPSVVVAARRGEEKLFPDDADASSRQRTGSARPARPASAAMRDSIRPMNLDALLAEGASS